MDFNQVIFTNSALSACEVAQVEYREPVAFSHPQRVRALNKKHANFDGSIIYFEHDKGVVFNWLLSVAVYFFPEGDAQQNESTKRELLEKVKAQRLLLQKDQERKHVIASGVAVGILNVSRGCNRSHGYLVKKRLTFAHRFLRRIPKREALQHIRKGGILDVYGKTQSLEGLTGNLLAVPLENGRGEVTSVQFIDENGTKRFLKGGLLGGSFWARLLHTVEGKTSKTIGICEGVATALSLYHVNKIPVVASMSAHNLKAVGLAIRELYPNATIVFYADRDASGIGLKRAKESAQALGWGVSVKLPSIGPEIVERFKTLSGSDSEPTDYNDLYLSLGLIE